MSDEKPIPAWQKIVAGLYVLAIIAEAVIWHTHLHADFIPFDTSHVAPNILASIIIVELLTPFGVLLWPPARRRLHHFADRKLACLHSKLDAEHQRAEEHRQWQHDAMHATQRGERLPDHPHYQRPQSTD